LNFTHFAETPIKTMVMTIIRVSIIFVILALAACTGAQERSKDMLPNIVYILADDMGYGDVGAYNPGSKISTPNIDRLAREGMRFTDAHSPSSVCTPTRYGILTGRYCWRTRLPKGVLRGYGQALIEQHETTVAELLREKGYTTGVVGKWHLGLDWILKEDHQDSLKKYGDLPIYTNMNPDWIDFSIPPKNGPISHGFDYSYILPASLDMDPYCYLENDVLTELPNEYTPGNDRNTPVYATGAFWREGRIAKHFDFYEVLPTFISKAKTFVQNHSSDEKPFFLYLPLAAPHTPWVPKDDFRGTSQAGQYGDFVQMVDAAIGGFLEQLKQSGVDESTIVFFTSDNGPYWRPDYIEMFDHRAADIYRGMKADAWDGGHRVPFIVRWPGRVAANSESDQLTTLTNLMATIADISGFEGSASQGMDSRSILPALMGGESDNTMPIIHHSSRGYFAIRTAEWKYIEGLGSGGFSNPKTEKVVEGGPSGQLYNMKDDPSETHNLYLENPGKVEELTKMLNDAKDIEKSLKGL
jgi:arylsulfatase A